MGDGSKSIPAVPPHVKPVGINYPWFKYGWDFGDPPPKWAQKDWKEKGWKKQVKKDIIELKNLGIFALRWFILADGLTYGIDEDAPIEDPNRKGEWRFPQVKRQQLPKLTDQFKSDFEWVIKTLGENNMKFVPSLIDFHFCWPGTPPSKQGFHDGFNKRGVKRGRSDVINFNARRIEFFNNVLKPLLEISKKYRKTIYAWELINEPEGATKGSGEGEDKDLLLARAEMNKMLEFIEEGIGIINKAGFRSTVGYRRLETILRWKGKKHQYLGVTLHQFHFYPKGKWYDTVWPWSRDDLPKHFFHQKWPCFIGEFATATEKKYEWPELSSKQTVYDRLKKIEEKGYPCAFPWASIERTAKEEQMDPYKRPAHDWSDTTKKSIKKYIFERP
jgi:hypothetical protein